jgi:hypothetical protein
MEAAAAFFILVVGGFVLVWLLTTVFVAADVCIFVARVRPVYFYAGLAALSAILGLVWNTWFFAIVLGTSILALCPLRLFLSRFMRSEDDKLCTHAVYKTLVLSSCVPAGFVLVSCGLSLLAIALYPR